MVLLTLLSALLVLVFATLLTFAVAVVIAPGGQAVLTTVSSSWNDFVYWARGLF